MSAAMLPVAMVTRWHAITENIAGVKGVDGTLCQRMPGMLMTILVLKASRHAGLIGLQTCINDRFKHEYDLLIHSFIAIRVKQIDRLQLNR